MRLPITPSSHWLHHGERPNAAIWRIALKEVRQPGSEGWEFVAVVTDVLLRSVFVRGFFINSSVRGVFDIVCQERLRIRFI